MNRPRSGPAVELKRVTRAEGRAETAALSNRPASASPPFPTSGFHEFAR